MSLATVCFHAERVHYLEVNTNQNIRTALTGNYG
jgi:hypothetical protein